MSSITLITGIADSDIQQRSCQTKHAPSQQRLVSLILSAMALAVIGDNARSEPDSNETAKSCPDGNTTVAGADAADFADICSGVAGSLKFFAVHGLRPKESVSIEVATSLPEVAGPTAVGCYIEQRRRVYIVPYSAFLKNKTWFGVSINREIYRALSAHEAAHAVTACHFRISKPAIQAREYLAYVAMFSATSNELRARVLRATPTEGFSSLDRFTPLLYMFDPMRFGAEAYRHFSGATNQTALIQDVLTGMVLVD